MNRLRLPQYLWTAATVALLCSCADDAPDGMVTDVLNDDSQQTFDTISGDDTFGDTSAEDTTPADDVEVTEGELGWPCQSNVECLSGWCVEGWDGYICTKLCEEVCPERFDCKSISSDGADIAFVCVPNRECDLQPGPDLAGDGIDTNCDGIDGEADNGVFVARNGDDAALGTQTSPLRTIGAGIVQAASLGLRDVYVASGVYAENIMVADGVGVFGGYSANFRSRDTVAYETAILGRHGVVGAPGTVTAVSVGQQAVTVVRGFSIFGPNSANVSGANSYAVYLRDVGEFFELRDNAIFAGAGGNGTVGNVGADGANGTDGFDGVDAYDIGEVANNGTRSCGSAHETLGGAGGQGFCGDGTSVSGGPGGDGNCPQWGSAPASGDKGREGDGPAPGVGGEAGWDLKVETQSDCELCRAPPNDQPLAAQAGAAGGIGQDGAGGQGCATPAGAVVGGHWVGGMGDDGVSGSHGSGGGGGGAGAGVEVLGNQCGATIGGIDIGGTGGGGGSGGCRARHGQGGAAGGGSFGVFITYTTAATAGPIVADNIVSRGDGGNGGNGGNGGVGGAAGFGGGGGAAGQGLMSFCAFDGGDGGDGGRGGHGGGGGGGCGGASFGVYVWAAGGSLAPSDFDPTNTFVNEGSGGLGGVGGASLGGSGTAGANGGAANVGP